MNTYSQWLALNIIFFSKSVILDSDSESLSSNASSTVEKRSRNGAAGAVSKPKIKVSFRQPNKPLNLFND